LSVNPEKKRAVKSSPGVMSCEVLSWCDELSYTLAVNLGADKKEKLCIYRDNFEKAYLESTQLFYTGQ